MSAPSRIGLAAIGVALAGLFAMHGLSPHGAHSSPEATSTHGDHGTDLSGGQLPAGGDEDALLALCLALLVAGVVGLVARARPIRMTARHGNRPNPGTSPATARRDRDPPDLHALSILRC